MKTIRIMVLAVLALASTATFAQKGGIWFDGNIGFNSQTNENKGTDIKLGSSTFDFNVSGNYMIADDWSLGLMLGYNLASADWMKEYANKTSVFSFGIQAYYFKPLVGNFVWAPRAYFAYGLGNYTHEDPVEYLENDYSFNTMTIAIEPLSFKYVVNQHFALTGCLNLANIYFTNTADDHNSASEFNFHLGNLNGLTLGNIGFRLGFAYTL